MRRITWTQYKEKCPLREDNKCKRDLSEKQTKEGIRRRCDKIRCKGWKGIKSYLKLEKQ